MTGAKPDVSVSVHFLVDEYQISEEFDLFFL